MKQYRAERRVYDVPEFGAKLGLSRNASYAAANRGDFPLIQNGKRKVVPKVAGDRLLEEGTRGDR
jgi:hypothetical protein